MTERYSLVASSNEVDAHITRLATELLAAHPTTPLFVALLKGAAPFASKLMFELARHAPDFHPEIDYMMVATYGTEQRASEPRIITDLDPRTAVENRTVVILDDVLDKGITADFVRTHLQYKGATKIELCVLVDKQTERLKDIQADYTGLQASDEWLVGLGMDDADLTHEGHRWLNEIRQINRT